MIGITGLINNAIIDWFLPWPEQALYAVSTTLISEDVSNFSHEESIRDDPFLFQPISRFNIYM